MTGTIDPAGTAAARRSTTARQAVRVGDVPRAAAAGRHLVAGVPRGRRLRRQLPQVLRAFQGLPDTDPLYERPAQPHGGRLRRRREDRQPPSGVVDRRADGAVRAPALRRRPTGEDLHPPVPRGALGATPRSGPGRCSSGRWTRTAASSTTSPRRCPSRAPRRVRARRADRARLPGADDGGLAVEPGGKGVPRRSTTRRPCGSSRRGSASRCPT